MADLSAALRRAIVLVREAGLEESAAELEGRVFAAYTTSSEWLGEVGEAIRRLHAREGARVPAEAARLLGECLREVGRVWPEVPVAGVAAGAARESALRPLPGAARARG